MSGQSVLLYSVTDPSNSSSDGVLAICAGSNGGQLTTLHIHLQAAKHTGTLFQCVCNGDYHGLHSEGESQGQ